MRSHAGGLADEIGGFANSSGENLLCGVTDRGETQGMTRTQMDALERVVLEACLHSVEPEVHVKITRSAMQRDKPVMLVQVPEGHALHRSQGPCFVRAGASKKPLERDGHRRLARLPERDPRA